MEMQQLLVAGLATFAIATLGIIFLEPLLTGEARAEKRQVAIAGGRERKRAVEEASNRRRQVAETLKELDARQTKKKLTLEQRFEQAGVTWTKKTYILISIGCALGFGLVALIASKMPILAAGAAFMGGFAVPSWILTRLALRRQKKFLEEFPNAIEAIVRGIKSGLPLNDCLRLVSTEAREPVRTEFRSIVESQQMGIAIADSCSKMFERIPISEVNFFGIVLQIQSKSGGNLGEILLNLSRTIRDRKKLRDKVQAVSQEAKTSAIIIGALPFLVGTLTFFGSPEYISLLWTTKAGMVGLGACVGIMFVGVMVMRKMINFDI